PPNCWASAETLSPSQFGVPGVPAKEGGRCFKSEIVQRKVVAKRVRVQINDTEHCCRIRPRRPSSGKWFPLTGYAGELEFPYRRTVDHKLQIGGRGRKNTRRPCCQLT